jgi:twinkle protein
MEPCPECGSKDNLARYDDGHGYCFGCAYYEHDNSGTSNVFTNTINIKEKIPSDYRPIRGTTYGLTKRGISEETCRKYGYSIGEYQGARAHIANFVQEGRIVGQKLRLKNKDFRILGDCSGLWGKHLWNTGKKIVITEGEIDALSVAEVQNCKWPTVSIPNGVNSSVKAVSKDMEWLLGFDEIVLMFDMDEQGQTSAKKVAELLPPGKCKIANLTNKDANEVLQSGNGSAIVSAIWNAKVYRPDGIIAGEDTWDLVKADDNSNAHLYPWEGLNARTLGARRGEIVTFCAGTGAGKSTTVKEIASYFLSKGETIGYIALEESVRQAAIDFMSIEANKMLHLEKNYPIEFVTLSVVALLVGWFSIIYQLWLVVLKVEMNEDS